MGWRTNRTNIDYDKMSSQDTQTRGSSSSSEDNGSMKKVIRTPLRSVVHRRHHVTPPAHHVVAQAGTRSQAILDSLPIIPSLMPTHPETLYSSERTSVFLNAGPTKVTEQHADGKASPTDPTYSGANGTAFIRTGFQNPWDSWHKPTMNEMWNGLRWGQGSSSNGSGATTSSSSQSTNDGKTTPVKHRGHAEHERYRVAIEEARRKESSGNGHDGVVGGEGDVNASTLMEQSKELRDGLTKSDLAVHTPTFDATNDDARRVCATWLGHATVLLQLPPTDAAGSPIRILFDPIFSMRCSPTQYVGPIRLYPPPCPVGSLPPIDVVCISHSHYDHLDYDSIVQLWKANAEHLRFVVPLGNKAWFLGLGLEGLDEERVTELDWWDETWLSTGNDNDESDIRLICTPAQHGSGRYGVDAGRTLWSSWTVERRTPKSTFRAFFGGDTGFQFRSSSPQATEYPTCPAFEEVRCMIGAPHLSFLPISVGATFNFVKSYDAFGLVPELDGGLTGANHMTPYDAVRVAKILSARTAGDAAAGVVMAIHWGTFVSGIDEVRQSMHDLESACTVQGVHFARAWEANAAAGQDVVFACIDHGRSIWLDLPTK